MNSHLSDGERERIRQELVNKKEQLEKWGDFSQEFELRALQQTEEALERIQLLNFGVCAECEESILFERLMAVPETRYCVDCENALEAERVIENQRAKTAYAL